MRRLDFDRHSNAAGQGPRVAPWLGLASLGLVAMTVALTQARHDGAALARQADAALHAWRGDIAPGGEAGRPVAADIPFLAPASDGIAAPSAAAASTQAVEPPAPLGPAAASVVDLEDESGFSSFAMMPTAADVLGSPPGYGVARASDAVAQSGPADAETDGAADHEEYDPPGRHTQHKVGKGETLAKALEKLGIAAQDRAKIVTAAKGMPELAKIKAGQHLHARLAADGSLMALHVPLSQKTALRLSMEEGKLRAERHERRGEKRLSFASARVQSSLYADGEDAGLSDEQIAELAAIFGWDVDFASGLRAGDRFSVIYEAEYIDGRKADDGDILAAELVNKGRTYRAVRFEDEDGTIGYYAPDGTSKKQAFLRNPLKLARVTSGFSLSRFHPVLQERRAHKGVDYSAPMGTPVKATGNGVVQFSGRQNGYGNVIELQHGDKYTTVYGHLSRFAEGVAPGARVQQGQIIGYVGQTGIATGPHLHYEFRIAGQHRDPLSVQLPAATPLKDDKLAEFKQRAEPLVAQLENLNEGSAARAP